MSELLGGTLTTDPRTLSGTPVIRGSRIPASAVLADLADGSDISEIAIEYDLEEPVLKKFLTELSIRLNSLAVTS